MIQLLPDRFEGFFDRSKILNPARAIIDRTVNVDKNSVGVSVEAVTFVTFRYLREMMCCIDAEFLENFHAFFAIEGVDVLPRGYPLSYCERNLTKTIIRQCILCPDRSERMCGADPPITRLPQQKVECEISNLSL